jgi:hypothetical protein
VFGGRPLDGQGQKTLDFLLAFRPENQSDPYVLALLANAITAMAPESEEVRPYLARLEGLKKSSDAGKLCWWEQPPSGRTTFFGAGHSGAVETTALATLALLNSNLYPPTARGALTWIASQKDGSGTWQSTQATVLALKALLLGTGKALGGEKERRIELVLGDGIKKEIVIPSDQGEVMRQVDLSEHLRPGVNRLVLSESSGATPGYQVVFRYHVPQRDDPAAPPEPLAITLDYDKTELPVKETVRARVTVTNQMKQSAPMILIDLPIPAGFAIVKEDLTELVRPNALAKVQFNARSAVIYVRELAPNDPLAFSYRLRATMPVKITAPPARVYEYYDTDKQGRSKPTKLAITPDL